MTVEVAGAIETQHHLSGSVLDCIGDVAVFVQLFHEADCLAWWRLNLHFVLAGLSTRATLSIAHAFIGPNHLDNFLAHVVFNVEREGALRTTALAQACVRLYGKRGRYESKMHATLH